ncbi:SRPBCC family protein [Pseudonocardia sp. CA-107938]|uniref:SRPBCC family protein n=1 Tax=Pseudonocardia sp. CA-107938 TaxID=3240021 RepID=UPI003D931351
MRRLTSDEVRAHVPAPPERVYQLVSDVTRIPEWSPEVVRCTWLDGATGPAVGARFRATNKKRWFRWSNKPVVDVADAPREFAVTRTEPGGGSIRWTYLLSPDGTGTEVALRYDVLQPVPVGLHVVLRVLLGVRDLHDDLHANMETSLQRIAQIVASAAPVAD